MEPVKIEWHVGTGYVGSDHTGTWEIDREDWDAMSEQEREKYLDDMLEEEIRTHIHAGYEMPE